MKWILKTKPSFQGLLVRIVVGFVFTTEGIQKFLFPALLGMGRFEKLGFTNPEFWSVFTAAFEITCGGLIILGLGTRLASIPLLIIMGVAFVTTKWPILVSQGFWAMAHEYRTDFSMTFLLIYLLIYGAGKYSIDLLLNKNKLSS